MSSGRGVGRVGVAARRRTGAWAAALLVAVVAAGAALPATGASLAPVAAQQRFREAGRAYAEGRMPDAARLYEELIRGGHHAPEIYYNLGNAALKSGRPASAVLNYRKAWRLAPRDPDISANLLAALRATGVSEPDLSGAEIAFTTVSENAWATIAAVAWWTACLLLSAAILRGRRWGFLAGAAAAAGGLVVVALLGLWTWRGFERHPELVVLQAGTSARVAPDASSSARFPLPEGSIVRARGALGEWVEVSSGQLTGWIPRADCAPALPGAASD